MLIETLLVAHIVVLGYWLGADLVINSTYRYVCWARNLPFDERNKLMDHVMHRRPARSLCARAATRARQLTGGSARISAVRSCNRRAGRRCGGRLGDTAGAHFSLAYVAVWAATRPDRLRFAWVGAGILLLLMSLAAFAQWIPMPRWLAIKLALFGCVFLAGVGIRAAPADILRRMAVRLRTVRLQRRAGGQHPKWLSTRDRTSC